MSRVAMRFYLDDSDDESKDESGEPAWLSTCFTAPRNTNPAYFGLPLAKARQCRELLAKIRQIDKQCLAEYKHSEDPSVIT